MRDPGCRLIMKPLRLAAIVVALGASAQPAALAETKEMRTDYSVSFIGLPVANVSFVTRFVGRDFRISGNLSTSIVGDIVEKTRGTAEVSGSLAPDRLLANSFAIAYTSGKKRYSIEMMMKNGTVLSAVSRPEKKRPANWVPVTAEHKRSVLDPLSSLVIPAGDPVCPRKLPIFDGASRYDLVLEPKGSRPYSTTGFSGTATVCAVRLVPHAGFRRGNRQVDYVRNLKGIEIWFARSPAGDHYAPVYAKVPTRVGQVIIAATRFGG